MRYVVRATYTDGSTRELSVRSAAHAFAAYERTFAGAERATITRVRGEGPYKSRRVIVSR